MRSHRRRWLASVSSLVALLLAPLQGAWGQLAVTRLPRQSAGSGRVASLKDQLEKGLKARRDVEFKFIAKVVELVEQKKLPLKMVLETFHYARRKRPYPFQYFQRALAIRAERIGVKLTPV